VSTTQRESLLGLAVGFVLGLFSRLIWRAFSVARVTILWALAAVALVVFAAPGWLVVLYLVAFVGTLLGTRRWFWTQSVAPFVADFLRARDRRQQTAGNALLRDLGFTSAADERRYAATVSDWKDGRRLFWVQAPLPGLTDPVKVEDQIRSRLAVVPAADVSVVQEAPSQYAVTFYADARPDARRELAPLGDVMAWDGDWDRLPIGVREDGSLATMRVANTSGTVVGGLPGGGKTAGLTAMLSAMGAHPAVQFLVWDGKGGADWDWIIPRASLFNNDDEDRARVADELESVVAVMRDRVQTMKERRGGSSIWNTGGPSEDMPLLVCVVDECQTYLDATAIPKSDKEAQEIRQRTEAAIATLVRKGRSAGIWVIPTTQKPTADSLPTTIGANAASAIAFRVKTPEAERAVLGSGPGEDDPSATGLPPEPGYAVVSTEGGTREAIRFPYVPEHLAAQAMAGVSHLRRDVLPAL
jgi:DNA segregation ATPase FtsK/SpoIIIE-like protein